MGKHPLPFFLYDGQKLVDLSVCRAISPNPKPVPPAAKNAAIRASNVVFGLPRLGDENQSPHEQLR